MTAQEWYWRWRIWFKQKKIYYKLIFRYKCATYWVRFCDWLDKPFTWR